MNDMEITTALIDAQTLLASRTGLVSEFTGPDNRILILPNGDLLYYSQRRRMWALTSDSEDICYKTSVDAMNQWALKLAKALKGLGRKK